MLKLFYYSISISKHLPVIIVVTASDHSTENIRGKKMCSTL